MNQTQPEFQLLENLKPELTSFCYRMLGSIDDADDAVQEIYIRVWQKWSTFRQESSYKTWVYRIASNLCLDKLYVYAAFHYVGARPGRSVAILLAYSLALRRIPFYTAYC